MHQSFLSFVAGTTHVYTSAVQPKVKALIKHIDEVHAFLEITIPKTTTLLSEINADEFHETRLI